MLRPRRCKQWKGDEDEEGAHFAVFCVRICVLRMVSENKRWFQERTMKERNPSFD